MKKTKEQLIEENAKLIQRIETIEKKDYSTRETLSELLDSYQYENEWGGGTKKKVFVRDWLGIAFLIGELKADADYAMCVQARDDLKTEVVDLRQKIYELQNPKTAN